jgi:hypothetical protein
MTPKVLREKEEWTVLNTAHNAVRNTVLKRRSNAGKRRMSKPVSKHRPSTKLSFQESLDCLSHEITS